MATITFKMSTGDTLRFDGVDDPEYVRIVHWFRSAAANEVIAIAGSKEGMTHNVQKAHVTDLITAE